MKSALAPIFVLAIMTSAARADFIATATLTGSQEVPPNTSPATGSASLVYETATNEISYVVSFTGLTTGLTNAHIHFGAAGVAGPVILPFSNLPLGQTSGILAGVLTSADFVAAGGLTTFAQAVQAIQAGNTYVNIHTSTFPGGEIRGQLVTLQVVPEPSSFALLAAGCAAVVTLALRRRVPRS